MGKLGNVMNKKLINEDNSIIKSIINMQKACCSEVLLNHSVRKGEVIWSDLLFDSLPSKKLKKYTDISGVSLLISFKGNIVVSLYLNRLFSAELVCEKLLSYTLENYVQDKTFELKLNDIPSDGRISFAVEGLADESVISKAEFVYKGHETNDVKLALVFCTYNRKNDVLKNLSMLEDRLIDLNSELYVIDNACNLDPLEVEKNKLIHLIQNKNTGGSGGFARGMMEISKDLPDKGFTHFVLMDDDIDLYPSVLERLITFLSHLKDEYKDSFIGGSMLRRDMDYFVVETGAKRDGLSVKGNGFGLDMRDPKDCLINDSFEDADYNAWWFCCIPVSYLRDDNYPLPIFFQWDDVDYGIRNKARVITMNGICVWHDCFDSKRSAQMIYYSSRNPMIVDACHEGRMSKRKYLKHFRNIIRDQIYMYRYHEAEAILRGVEDFLKGPDWLINLKQEEYNREIMKLNVPLQSCDVDMDRYYLCIGIEDCDLLHKLVRLLTLNGMLLKANRKIIIPLYAWRPVQTYRATEVIYYDELTKRGYTAKKDLKKAFECYKKYRKLRRRVAREYDKVGALYKERYPYMTSKECWEKILFNT